MLQVFRDCCLKAYQQSGVDGLFVFWGHTLFDWIQTVIEEQFQRSTEMTQAKFVRLSGWSLILAAVSLALGFGIGLGETVYNDPLGGADGFYEYGQLILIPATLLLFTVGMVGLRLEYGKAAGALGNIGLAVAVVGGVLAFLAAIPLFGQMAEVWVSSWWTLTFGSMLVMLLGLSLFGIVALRTKPLPRWNALPLFTGIWFPLVFLIGSVSELLGSYSEVRNSFMTTVALTFMFVGFVFMGYLLQKATPMGSPA
jgi:hypothetical protein